MYPNFEMGTIECKTRVRIKPLFLGKPTPPPVFGVSGFVAEKICIAFAVFTFNQAAAAATAAAVAVAIAIVAAATQFQFRIFPKASYRARTP